MMGRTNRKRTDQESNHEDRQRIEALLLMRLGHLGFIIDRQLQFPYRFPYDVLGHHTVALGINDLRVSESGTAARVTVSIQALLDYPPLRARRAGDQSPRRTEVKEFKSVVQIQTRATTIEEFGDLELVPPAKLLTWPEDV